MGRITRLRSSYAGVTATVALVLALGMGGAYAADKIGSKQIATNAVKSKHIKNGQVKTPDLAADVEVSSAETADTAKVADTAKEADTARSADKALNVLAANVENGCLNAATTTAGFTVKPTAADECEVTFPRDLGGCAITLGAELAFPGGGETTYRKVTNSIVQVSRRDSAGGTPTAGAFSIVATCFE